MLEIMKSNQRNRHGGKIIWKQLKE
jgi:hypothetical protein